MKQKRILVCGPIFDTPAGPSGQGGKLYTQLKKEGYTIYKRSNYKNVFFRIIDTLSFVLFKSSKYDIILIQMFSNWAFVISYLVTNLAKLLHKETIPIIRGGAFVEFAEKFPSFVLGVLRKSTLVTSPSHFIGNYVKGKGIPITYVPNFIHIEKFPFKWKISEEKTLLWVRGFTDIYKPEFAIRVVHQLKAIYPTIKLTMVGPDMGKLEFCKELISTLGLQENIQITGPISNDELNKYYASHAIYINTTSYESFGVALVEAACSGIPIVSTDVGEIPLMWKNQEEMLIVQDKDENEFVHQIKLLFEDKELQMKLSKNARLKAEQFSWEKIKQQWAHYLS